MSGHRRCSHWLGALGVRAMVCCAAGTLLFACRRPVVPPAAGKIAAVVSIPPQAYFVQRVGGDHVNVNVLIGPGQSHHTYEPTPKQISGLAQARVFFRIGVPFERKIIGKISAGPDALDVVDTSHGIPFREAGEACVEDGLPHAHDAGRDPHIWLAPKLAKLQAQSICNALCRIDPAHAAEYRANLLAFGEDLDAVDRRVAETLAPLKGRAFFVFHPAYGYFGDAYGLTQVAVEEAGKEPGVKRVQQLIERARRERVRLIFVQPQFPVAAAKTVADAIGGAVVPLDPLAADYLANLEYMADRIADGLRPVDVAATTHP